MQTLYKSETITIREFLAEEELMFSTLFDDEKVTRFIPNRSPEQYIEIFHDALADYKKGPFGRWGVFSSLTNDFVGMCLLRNFIHVPGQLEIGYTLSPRFWGKGIATEVSKALTEYAFAITNTEEVVAVTDTDNIGSQKVLLKAGFKQLDNLKRDDEELSYFIIERVS
jgi:ribosomal-protein-alanine N-acetyltransferase